MASLETLQKIYDFCDKAADLVREYEGSTAEIPLNALRQRLAQARIVKFTINNNAVTEYFFVGGSSDTATPDDDVDYLRKTFTNFAKKVRNGSEKLSIDQLLAKEDAACGLHKNTRGEYEIRIPNGVTSIGNGVFRYCSDLYSVTIPSSVTSIGEQAFSQSYLRSVTIPNSVTSIDEKAFYDCNHIASITIPSSVTSIG